MRKSWSAMAAGLTLVLAGMQSLQHPVSAQQRQGPNLGDMFIAEDADGFDPGLAIGTQFPSIQVLYRGEEISAIDQFMGESGAVFIANRSANW